MHGLHRHSLRSRSTASRKTLSLLSHRQTAPNSLRSAGPTAQGRSPPNGRQLTTRPTPPRGTPHRSWLQRCLRIIQTRGCAAQNGSRRSRVLVLLDHAHGGLVRMWMHVRDEIGRAFYHLPEVAHVLVLMRGTPQRRASTRAQAPCTRAEPTTNLQACRVHARTRNTPRRSA